MSVWLRIAAFNFADFFFDEVMFSFVLTGQQEHVKYRLQSSVWRGQTQRRILGLVFSILQSGSCLVSDGCPTGKNCILPNTSEQPLNRHQICQPIGRIPLWSSLCSTKNNNKLLKNPSSCENEHQICQPVGRIPLWSSLCSTKNNKLLKNPSSCENEIGFKKIIGVWYWKCNSDWKCWGLLLVVGENPPASTAPAFELEKQCLFHSLSNF